MNEETRKRADTATDPARRGACGGCLVRGAFGCGAFLAGATVVVFALAPTLTRGWVAKRLERDFDLMWAGRLDLGEVELSWADSQRAPDAALLDPGGEVIVRGALTAPPLFELLTADERGSDLRWTFRAEEARIVEDEAGRTNLARALTLTDSGRLELDRARRRGRPWGTDWGVGRRAVRLALEVGRVVRVGPDGEATAFEDLEALGVLAPGRGAELVVEARSPDPGGEPTGEGPAAGGGAAERDLLLRASFPSEAWWRAADAPFELEVRAAGWPAAWVPPDWRRALGELHGPAFDVELLATRASGAEGRLRLGRLASGALDLTAEGGFVAPGITRADGWEDGPPLRVAELAGTWRGAPLGRLGAAARAWAGGAEADVGFALTVTADGAGARWPLWVLELQLPDARVGPAELRGVRATLSGSGPDAPVGVDASADGVVLELRGTARDRRLADAEGRIEVTPERPDVATALLATLVPFVERVSPGPRPLVGAGTHLDLPLATGAGPARGSLRLDPGGAALRLAAPLARVLGTAAAESVVVGPPGTLDVELEGGVVRYAATVLAGPRAGLELRLAGTWDRAADELDLRVVVPMGSVAAGAVSFLDENRDLIGVGVDVPLVVRGPVADPTVEVDARFRADILEGALGSMRDAVDSLRGAVDRFGEQVGRPLGDETRELLEELGLLKGRD